jgi:hypothetical protein
MKKFIYISLLLGLTSCFVYKPSSNDLLKNGFQQCKVVAGTEFFDTYSRKLKNPYFTEVGFYPSTNTWTIWAGNKGVSSVYFRFTVNNKKEFKLILENFK